MHRNVRHNRLLRQLSIMGSAVPWYLAGSIPIANCIAAYQPKGAASYAASKVNLANPGTNDLSDGAAFPTWAAATGWTFVAASSQYLTIASALVTAVPLSMVCRFVFDDVGDYILTSICDTAAENYFLLHSNNVTDKLQAVIGHTGTYGVAASILLTAVTDYTGAAVFASNTSRSCYVNGTNKNTDATNVTPLSLDATYIGACHTGVGMALYLKGKISACAFYNIELSDAQVSVLHNAMVVL